MKRNFLQRRFESVRVCPARQKPTLSNKHNLFQMVIMFVFLFWVPISWSVQLCSSSLNKEDLKFDDYDLTGPVYAVPRWRCVSEFSGGTANLGGITSFSTAKSECLVLADDVSRLYDTSVEYAEKAAEDVRFWFEGEKYDLEHNYCQALSFNSQVPLEIDGRHNGQYTSTIQIDMTPLTLQTGTGNALTDYKKLVFPIAPLSWSGNFVPRQYIEFVPENKVAQCYDDICDYDGVTGIQESAGPIDVATGVVNFELPIMGDADGLLPINLHYSNLPIVRKADLFGMEGLTRKDAAFNSPEELKNSLLVSPWRHSYDKRVIFSKGFSDSLDRVYLYLPNSDIVIFKRQSGAWASISHSNVRGRLVNRGDPWSGNFSYHGTNGYNETYINGHLSEVTYPDGRILTFTHDYMSGTTIISQNYPKVGLIIETEELGIVNGAVSSIRSLYNENYKFTFNYTPIGTLPDVYMYPRHKNLTSIVRPDHSRININQTSTASNQGSTMPGMMQYIFLDSVEMGGYTLASFLYDEKGRGTKYKALGYPPYTVNYNNLSATVQEPLGAVKVFSQKAYTVTDSTLEAGVKINRITQVDCTNCNYTVNANYTNEGDIQSVERNGDLPYQLSFSPEGLVNTANFNGSQSRTYSWNHQKRQLTEITGSDILPTLIGYDGQNHLNAITLTGGNNTRTITLDRAKGDVNSIAGVGRDKIDYKYNARGFRRLAKNKVGISVKAQEFNHLGLPRKIIDPNGIETNITYDKMGRILTISPNGVEEASFSYNALGMLDSSTYFDETFTPSYDGSGRIINVSSSCGGDVNYKYNYEGLLESKTTRDNNTSYLQRYQYDPEGRLTQVESHYPTAGVRTTNYNKRGQVANSTDGNTTSVYSYNSNGHLEGVSSNPLQSVLLTKNLMGQPLTTTSPGGVTTTNKYTGFGETKLEKNVNWGYRKYLYNATGLHKTSTTPLLKHVFAYDKSDRLTGSVLTRKDGTSPSINTSYTYDDTTLLSDGITNHGVGRLTGINNGTIATHFIYDHRGSIVGQQFSHPHDTAQKEVIYRYNHRGQLIGVIYPNGDKLEYKRNCNQVTEVKWNDVLITEVGYGGFKDQLIRSLELDNGIAISRDFDSRGRLSKVSAGTAINLMWEQKYTYDGDQNLEQINDTSTLFKLGSNQTFTYDQANRLKTANGQYGSLSYSYNLLGGNNRISSSGNGTVQKYKYWKKSGENRDRLNAIYVDGNPIKSFSYDNDGAVKSQNDLTYHYDAAGRLASVLDSGVQIAEYTYDANGRRIKKVTTDGTIVFHYDIQGNLIEEVDENGVMLRQYIYLDNNQPLAIISAETDGVLFVHSDHLGTPRFLTNKDQKVVWASEQKPFGETTVTVSDIEYPIRLPGQYYDKETGLHYNEQRYYDPSLGRYLRNDPIGLEGGVNTYAYAQQNPLMYVDPDGRAPHRWADGNYSDNDGQDNPGWSVQINRAQGQIGYGLSQGWQYSPAIMIGAGEGVALFGLLKQGFKSVTKGETTTLYRAVSQGELKDISKDGFRMGNNSMGNKWFAESAEDAAAWGQKFFKWDKEPVWTLKVTLPKSTADTFGRRSRLDGIGPARSADAGQLKALNANANVKALMGNALKN